MRQARFTEIIESLKTDPFFAINVFDRSKNQLKKILTDFTNEKFTENYGSVESYFNSLFSNNINKIGIQIKRKNGSVFKSVSNSIEEFDLSGNENNQNEEIHLSSPVINPVLPPPVSYNNQPFMGLNGFGLSGADIMNMHADSRDKVRLENENRALKDKVERLEKENLELTKKEFVSDLKKNSSEGTKEMFNSVFANADKISLLLSALVQKNPAPVPGLGSPEIGSNISPVKAEIIEIISQNDDYYANFLLNISSKINDQVFFDKLKALLDGNTSEN